MERPPPREAEVTWGDGGIPVSTRYGEAFWGSADALGEARHVFLGGNRLPGAFRAGFHIAELGFGTGLNALAAALAWRAAGRTDALRYTAFEAHPMPATEMARALGPWPELSLATPLVEAWATGARALILRDEVGPVLELDVVTGDARETLPPWTGRADAWFLDGFSPARNPELWEPALIAAIAAKSRPGTSLATYSAAGAVRAALAAAGFVVERVPGFGRKKHMTRAWLAEPGART